jgi:two-component system chemotaxis response regulator CheB
VIRVLVVDDSGFMRKALTHILEFDKNIQVAGTAANGEEAIGQTKKLKPDVVLLDIEMPVMDGLDALSHIMTESPVPVLILSGLRKTDARIAIRALEKGAVDFIGKPSGVISYDIDKIAWELRTKVKMAAGVDVRKLKYQPLPAPATEERPGSDFLRKQLVVIGASTGGPRAVSAILSKLPREIGASILVVQHMGSDFLPSFVERLKWETRLDVAMARKGDTVIPGKALIAPGEAHVMIQAGEPNKIRLTSKPAPLGICPSIDFTMESAAKAYGPRTLGVLLTGIGEDGVKGMRAIKDYGGHTIAEDESTCVVFGMPRAAIEAKVVDEIVPLPWIAPAIMRMVGKQ